MKIKQLPQDFVVEEINDLEIGEGNMAVFKVTKINHNTEEVAQIIAHKLRIPRKIIGYSGSKDRNAITKQYFTIKISKEKALELEKMSKKDLEFNFLGFSNKSLSLGSLEGNKFTIVVRDIDKEFKINNNPFFPNYFGEQRFSSYNAKIGELIIKKKFKEATTFIEKTTLKNKQLQKIILENKKNPIKILRSIPKFTLMLYLHAYQSKLFNKLLLKYVEKHFSETFNIKQEQKLFFPKQIFNYANLDLPLPGFGVNTNKSIIEDYKELLKEEGIQERDFIIRSLPGMSLEGTTRKGFAKVKNVNIGAFQDDELNKDKKKIIISFELPKGSYATIYLKSRGINYQ